MKYQLPDSAWVKQQKRWKVPAVVIAPENGESLVDLAVKIARASVETSPRSSGMGLFDPRARETLITEEDLRELRAEAKTGRIKIDYWKGRPEKLTLNIKEDHITISLNVWADRWDTNATNTIPDFAVTNLGKILIQASA